MLLLLKENNDFYKKKAYHYLEIFNMDADSNRTSNRGPNPLISVWHGVHRGSVRQHACAYIFRPRDALTTRRTSFFKKK